MVSSKSEGFGNIIIEAWACGVPVVATECRGAPRELMGSVDERELVPVGQPKTLAKAMIAMLHSPPSAHSLRERAAPYSVEICAARYRSLAMELADRR